MLGPVEGRLLSVVGLVLCVLSILVLVFPRIVAYPAAVLGLWGGLALLWRALRLRRSAKQGTALDETRAVPTASSAEKSEG